MLKKKKKKDRESALTSACDGVRREEMKIESGSMKNREEMKTQIET
jgi:hypothetical protein